MPGEQAAGVAEAAEPKATPLADAVDEPVEPAPPVGGPSCDQRELAADGEPRRVCIDYSDHRGASSPRCFEGVELSEGPCPREDAVASCTLEATGVVMRYYAGVDAQKAKADCEAIRGDYLEESGSGSAGAR